MARFRELGDNVEAMLDEDPWFVCRFHRGLEYVRQKKFVGRREKPKVYWFYGPTGTGKSYTAIREMSPPGEKPYIHHCNSKWFNSYEQQHVAIFDDLRADAFKFSELLRLLDEYEHMVETKGGMIHFNSPIVVITCPFHPSQVYKDREDMEQLIRRIDEIRYFDVPYKK